MRSFHRTRIHSSATSSVNSRNWSVANDGVGTYHETLVTAINGGVDPVPRHSTSDNARARHGNVAVHWTRSVQPEETMRRHVPKIAGIVFLAGSWHAAAPEPGPKTALDGIKPEQSSSTSRSWPPTSSRAEGRERPARRRRSPT